MNFPLLTNRLSIEPLSSRDLDIFVRYRQDPEIARYQSWETNYSREDALQLIQAQAAETFPEKGQWLQYAIHLLKTQELVGDIGLHRLAEEEFVFELGFTVAREHQGQGIAKEAISRLMSELFEGHSARKIIATTDERNTASIKVLTGLGFLPNQAKDWTETFKNEQVRVLYFETSASYLA